MGLTPSEVHVGEAVYTSKLTGCEDRHTTKHSPVRQSVVESVHGHRHVAGSLFRAPVQIPVVFR